MARIPLFFSLVLRVAKLNNSYMAELRNHVARLLDQLIEITCFFRLTAI